MALIADLLARVRLELSDTATPFISQITADGVTSIYDLPQSPVSTVGLSVQIAGVEIGGYSVDAENGSLIFDTPPVRDAIIQARGTGYRFFSDDELLVFIKSATAQHLHNRNMTLATMPPVEDYLLVLLATIEALYALLNDATFDIDVNTPEGVSIPRHQRMQQIMQMIQLREKQYTELSQALNVGLMRVEQFTLRRVSRRTGRLVPVYKPREIEDTAPPQRVFLTIDGQGGDEVDDPNAPLTLDIRFRQGNTFTLPLVLGTNLTGCTVYASLRRYPQSARIRDFAVTVTDAPSGAVTLTLDGRDTTYLAHQLFWTLDVHDGATGNERTYYVGRAEVDRARYSIAQPYGV